MASAAEYDRAATDIRRPGTELADGILDVRELIRHATLAASSHNTQPWKFRIRQDSIVILPDYSRRCPVVDPDDSHLFKSLGCAAENLVHAAAAQGFSADVQFDSGEDHVIVHLNRDNSACATDLYRAITRRQCVKTPYDGKPLRAPELESWRKRAKDRMSGRSCCCRQSRRTRSLTTSLAAMSSNCPIGRFGMNWFRGFASILVRPCARATACPGEPVANRRSRGGWQSGSWAWY